jgi:hypothetical protein
MTPGSLPSGRVGAERSQHARRNPVERVDELRGFPAATRRRVMEGYRS